MEHWGRFQRARYAAWQCAGLGFLGAGFELATLVARLKLPLTVPQLVLLGVADMLVLGATAAVLGVLVAPVQLVLGGVRTHRAIAAQIGLAGGLLAFAPLSRAAAQVALEGQLLPAVLLAVMAPTLGVVLFFNARYWLAREAGGQGMRLGFVPGAAALGLLLVIASALLSLARPSGGGFALEGDRSAVLITIDGLTRDDALDSRKMPSFAQLRADGVHFDDTVTPSAYPAAAQATVLTGLHPLRHRVLFTSALSRGFRSLPQLLFAEGYATAGFSSAWPISAVAGFDQGFGTFDDDFFPGLPLLKLAVPDQLANLVRLLGGPAGYTHRPADATVARFDAWHARHADRTFFAWIHLADPAVAAARGEDVDAALSRVDAAITAIRAALAARGNQDAVLLVAGTTGRAETAGLHDPWLRVPMVLVDPSLTAEVRQIPQQVRLLDIASTLLERLDIDGLDEQEGVGLTGYATGKRTATIWCPLVGTSPDGGVLFGMRNNGAKYLLDLERGTETLYDLRDDPGETNDISQRSPQSLELARSLLASDLVRLRSLLADQAVSPLPTY